MRNVFIKLDYKNRLKSAAGFTLIEVLVSVTIFAVVVSALSVLFNYTLKINRRTEAVRQATQGMRNFVEFLAKEVRNGQIDYGVINGQTKNTNAFYTAGPCQAPTVDPGSPPAVHDTYVEPGNNSPQPANRLAILTLDGDYECIYLAEGPGNTDNAGSAFPTGTPLGGASINSLGSSPTNRNPVLAMKKNSLAFEILSPPNVSVQKLIFTVKPTCDPYSPNCVNYSNDYAKTQPFVNILAQFLLTLPTGETTTINYQTSVSTNKYDVPNSFGGSAPLILGLAHHRKITVNSGQVPSPQAGFPMLINITDAATMASLKSGVISPQGYDIQFATNPDGTGTLNSEVESYDPTSGKLAIWVNLPAIVDGTTFYMFYGKAGVVSPPNPVSAVWDANYKGVYHLADGTTLNTTNSTGGTNGTLVNAPTAASGQIGGGMLASSAGARYMTVGNTPAAAIAVTYSAWFKATSFPGSYTTLFEKNDGTNYIDFHLKSVGGNGKLSPFVMVVGSGVNYDGTGTFTLNPGTWYYLTMTFDSTTGLRGYVNANLDNSVASVRNLEVNNALTAIGSDLALPNRTLNGIIDEPRISNIARSANWIKTEYNNQSAPGTFYTISVEQTP